MLQNGSINGLIILCMTVFVLPIMLLNINISFRKQRKCIITCVKINARRVCSCKTLREIVLYRKLIEMSKSGAMEIFLLQVNHIHVKIGRFFTDFLKYFLIIVQFLFIN